MKANKVMLLGRMVKDVELNNYGKGKNAGVWCNFSLAVNDGTDSDGEAKVQFISCKAFNKTAELLEQYVKKGNLVLTFGRIVNEKWEDEKKVTHWSQTVVIDEVQLLPNKTEDAPKSKKY